ncbi:multidrug SMR transporter [Methylobacterium gnaphalii]|nr:multidrug SMR transporter [Methylobacterium gnaphalii]
MRFGTKHTPDARHGRPQKSGAPSQPGAETVMAWAILVVAGLFEVGWAIGLKYAEGFTRLWPSIWTLVSMVVSVVLLSLAVKSLPLGTGYAVWTGIGTVGTVILGIVLFAEPVTAMRIGCIALVVTGILGLKFAE